MIDTKINTIQRVKTTIRIALTSVALALSGIIQTAFMKNGSSEQVASNHQFIIAVSVGVVLLLVVEVIAKYVGGLLDYSQRLRKFFLRSDFFEGIWLDTVDGINCAIVDIIYINGGYKIHGEYYDENQNLLGNWESIYCLVSKGKLTYSYFANYSENESEFRGFAEYTFKGKHNSTPHAFTGFFIDYDKTGNVKKRMQGQRLNAENAKQLNDLKSKKELIKQWAEKQKGN